MQSLIRFFSWNTDTQEEPDSSEETSKISDPKERRTLRVRILAFLVCVLAGFAVIRMTMRASADTESAVTQRALNGVRTLHSVNGDPVGPTAAYVIATQDITFRDGKFHGLTMLRADTDAGTSVLPFPDETVTRVVASADGRWLNVYWDGTFSIIDDRRIELRIGKAAYLATVDIRPSQHTVAFNHDPILTFHGEARYCAMLPPRHGTTGVR